MKQTAKCPSCGKDMVCIGKRISIPKKNNIRAWKRMKDGEKFWDRRRVRRGWKNRGPMSDTRLVYKYELVKDREYEDGFRLSGYSKRVIEGSEREVTNYDKKPEVDLGG